jgi:hypothetical protein
MACPRDGVVACCSHAVVKQIKGTTPQGVGECSWLEPRSHLSATGSFALQAHHPHCVQFFGAVTKSEPYMIVTEYMACGSLDDVFDNEEEHPSIRR